MSLSFIHLILAHKVNRMRDVKIQVGLPEALRHDAAGLYDGAFGAKLAVAVRADRERLALIEAGLMPAYAIVAAKTETFPYLCRLLGFGGVTTMEKPLDQSK